eukprot:CAMPEP_0205917382 /NCGR_PEP_ID=MMETSP1325-20131115/9120_1 /ASSEMBLY_ACC=CAM_ASM_000708 /TAXON_ID=236786 /ORGANISM="Florenciella sp., Strain RCC1007" /LENGTH=169 /DNA_ID=CAMNT_0053284793 /DNA_START=69 /DNA_END=578 /DNA_ORIENTATION=-
MRSFALILALLAGAATAFTPAPATAAQRLAPLQGTPSGYQRENARKSFCYGTGDMTPQPLGGTGRGYEADRQAMGSRGEQLQGPQQEFRYGSGSVEPKPLGGSGRGFAYDTAAAQKTARGSRSCPPLNVPKPLGGSGNGYEADIAMARQRRQTGRMCPPLNTPKPLGGP